jgi:integrase
MSDTHVRNILIRIEEQLATVVDLNPQAQQAIENLLNLVEHLVADLDEGVALSRAADNKGKRDHRHNITPVVDLLSVLHRVRKPGEPRVFPWNHAIKSLDRDLHRIQGAAGIHLHCPSEHTHTPSCYTYGFHAFRYGFAQNNTDHLTRDQVQEQMGHRSAQTTDRYIDYTKRMKAAQVDVYVPAALRKKSTG